jgi:hypothetical protein
MIDSIYHRAGLSPASAHQPRGQQPELDPNLRALLDHVAAELATEYIRLMEAASEASAEPAAATSACGEEYRMPAAVYARSAQMLRDLLGPIRLELQTPNIGRPFTAPLRRSTRSLSSKRPPTNQVRRAVRILCESGDGGN